MIVTPKGPELITAFKESINKLLDEMIEKEAWLKENDPDPQTTINYMIDKKLREWFNRGGNLGY